ncbi:MAG: 16S rRNA (guanine(966)-N(2))-methyltransferase RsmD [Bacillota bacterium]
MTPVRRLAIASPAGRRSAPGRRNRVRIIAGEWRSRLVEFPDAPGLRPTPDRVRETLFNWLGQHLDGLSCLDLFAGSGALGFEALSRGAKRVVMVERERAALEGLRESSARLGARNLEIVAADALRFLERPGERFDVAFVDPPYSENLVTRVLDRLPPRLNAGARVYAESAGRIALEAPWKKLREDRAGAVHYSLYEYNP